MKVKAGTQPIAVAVIEAKAEHLRVIGQILGYMGWVKRTLCAPGQAVKGLVICRDPDPKLSDALTMTNNIDVRYYSVSFKLREAP